MTEELNFGREIQMSMLPAEFPVSDDFSVAAVLHPAREVGGDFYDVFRRDDGKASPHQCGPQPSVPPAAG